MSATLVSLYGLIHLASSETYSDLCLTGAYNSSYDGTYYYQFTKRNPSSLVWYNSDNKQYLYAWDSNNNLYTMEQGVSWRIGPDYLSKTCYMSCSNAVSTNSGWYSILDVGCYRWNESPAHVMNYDISIAEGACNTESYTIHSSGVISGIIIILFCIVVAAVMIVFILWRRKRNLDRFRARFLNSAGAQEPNVGFVETQPQPVVQQRPVIYVTQPQQQSLVLQGQSVPQAQNAMVYAPPQQQVIYAQQTPQNQPGEGAFVAQSGEGATPALIGTGAGMMRSEEAPPSYNDVMDVPMPSAPEADDIQ